MKIFRTMDGPDEIDVQTIILLRKMVDRAWRERRYLRWWDNSSMLLGARIGIWIRTGVML